MTLNVEAARLSRLVQDVTPDVISWRRHLHQHPELSFQEEKTSQYVFDVLSSFGGLEISRPTKTSVVARLVGCAPGKVLAIRADMDALPIQEETDFAFKSIYPGIMHACGHDGHTAMLLGAAKLLTELKSNLVGEVRFLFQHAEELFPGGASELVEAGVMTGVNHIIGIHLKSTMAPGLISVVPGPVNAAPDTFHVEIIGSGGHAAYPHTTVDSVMVAVQTIANLQHVVSRNTDPLDRLVLSVTRIAGGTADNVIPGRVAFGGTVRSYNPEVRNQTPALMERIIQGVTSAHGATYTFRYIRGYAPVVNDAVLTRVVASTLKNVFGEDNVVQAPPTMGGEDFSAYQQLAPGTFFQVGAGYGSQSGWYPHHHPKFSLNEDALPVGVAAFVHLAFQLLTI